jgi:hypothetical protein
LPDLLDLAQGGETALPGQELDVSVLESRPA